MAPLSDERDVGNNCLVAATTVTVEVVAVALAVTAPLRVSLGLSFLLRVSGVDAAGRRDVDYALPSTAMPRSSTGRLTVRLRTVGATSGLVALLSDVADGSTVALTVADGLLRGIIVVTVSAKPSLDADSSGAVDSVDAVLTLRALLLPESVRDLLLMGDPSVVGLVVAGFPALAVDEAAIVARVMDLSAHSSSIMDADSSGTVDSVDAVLALRVLLLPESIRELLSERDPSVLGLVVAGFPALAADEANIVKWVLEHTGD